jgi:hypothetical protein
MAHIPVAFIQADFVEIADGPVSKFAESRELARIMGQSPPSAVCRFISRL